MEPHLESLPQPRSLEERLTVVEASREPGHDELARDVAAGLGRRPRSLPCRYFYDRAGSELFEEICTLEEYYPPRAEEEILRRYADEIVDELPVGAELVELGSGSASKTRLLIEALLRRQPRLRFIPIDISRSMLVASSRDLLRRYPRLHIHAVAAEYHAGLAHLEKGIGAQSSRAGRLLLWLGSTVGNFRRPDAAAFLGKIRTLMQPADRFLVGIDLRKDAGTLERAYDDARGVTARFNLNLLARINRELGGSFDLSAFSHRARYDEGEGRIEIHLVSQRRQQVRIADLGLTLDFEEGEAIHTEDSYKYSGDEIEALVDAAGLYLEGQWFDSQRRFSSNLLAPRSRSVA